MATILHVLFFSAIGGFVSLIGGILLISNKKTASSFANYATPFAAGALLAAAFLDLLPEASHAGDIENALTATLAGIVLFFLLERFLRWFHHHHEEEPTTNTKESNASLIIIGDTVHNFIDGIAIAAGFLVSVPTGIIVTVAVAAHEIPQEIGDFGLLLKKGLSAKKVIIVNVLSAMATVIAAAGFFLIGETSVVQLDIVLGLTAGFFIYIAVSDIIPSIHAAENRSIAGPQTAFLILGMLLVGIATTTLHGYIDQTDDHGHSQTQESEADHHDEEEDHEAQEHSDIEDHANEEDDHHNE